MQDKTCKPQEVEGKHLNYEPKFSQLLLNSWTCGIYYILESVPLTVLLNVLFHYTLFACSNFYLWEEQFFFGVVVCCVRVTQLLPIQNTSCDLLTIQDFGPALGIMDKVLVIFRYYLWPLQIDTVQSSNEHVVCKSHEAGGPNELISRSLLKDYCQILNAKQTEA